MTVNLENALRDLRHKNRSRVVWADAIAVNQQNIPERNQQVRLMRDIYGGASVVHSWLNVEIDPNCPAFLRFAQLSEKSTPSQLGNDTDFWEPVAVVGKDSYWERVWVQQEITYARKLIIHCRGNTISVESFRHYQHLIDTMTDQSATDIYYRVLPKILQERFPRRCEDDVLKYTLTRRSICETLLEALTRSRFLKAADPRDRVYGMLGLVKEIGDGDLRVDYELSVGEVYSDAIEFSLRQTQSLHFLAQATMADRNPDLALPSWVPDWGVIMKGSQLRRASPILEDAWAHISADPPHILQCGKILQTQGICIGKTARVVQDIEEDASGMIDTLSAWYDLVSAAVEIRSCAKPDIVKRGINRWIRAVQEKINLRKSAKKEQERFKAVAERSAVMESLLRTIMFISDTMPDQARDMSISCLEAVVMYQLAKRDRALSIPLLDQEPYTKVYDALLSCWQIIKYCDERIFATDTAIFGFASKTIQPGDELWFLYRCPMPMVLRPKRDHFLVVGPAKVDEMLESSVQKRSTEVGGNSDVRHEMRTIFLR